MIQEARFSQAMYNSLPEVASKGEENKTVEIAHKSMIVPEAKKSLLNGITSKLNSFGNSLSNFFKSLISPAHEIEMPKKEYVEDPKHWKQMIDNLTLSKHDGSYTFRTDDESCEITLSKSLGAYTINFNYANPYNLNTSLSFDISDYFIAEHRIKPFITTLSPNN